MDGNGRWAQKRGLIRTQGHYEGLKAAKRIVKAASDLGIKYLSLFAFSTENWRRTPTEVGFIMGLVKQYLKAELEFYRDNNIRIRYTGDITGLPGEIVNELESAMEETKNFIGMQVILAINYGGRDEIVRAVRKFAASENSMTDKDTGIIKNISEQDINACLDNPDVPDPDLIIRSSGEYRISNFLVWEAAYAEWYFSDKLWPDWEEEDLVRALSDFQGRKRRFGGALNEAEGRSFQSTLPPDAG